ncbi:MAG: NADH-quinone oxidoreductase subunit M [Cyanobacteria bacterium P01_H01_bin.74]
MDILSHSYYSILIAVPFVLALFSLLVPEGKNGKIVHGFALFGSVLLFLISMLSVIGVVTPVSETLAWMPSLGISYSVSADGLSQVLVVLTTFLTVMAAIASITSIHKRVKLYYSMFFTLIGSVIGVFLARDLFLYFLFWELELIPMYFLIAIWGGPRRQYASIKFVLYTLFGSVFLVAGLLALYFHAASIPALDHSTLFLYDTVKKAVGFNLPLASQVLIFTALFITFAVKLPVVPLHTWLPDAHVEAPTPVSMLLAGILLKMGSYGMLRLCFEFIPEAAKVAAPYICLLAVINIVYTAGIALVQKDLKKLIAYSSVSHMGFVLLGLSALNALGFNGAVFVMFAHGLVSAALFMCVGTLYNRTHTREISEYGGFAQQTPILFYFFLYTAMASLGLPLLVSFASETLVFYGAFTSNAFETLTLLGNTFPWSIQALTVVSGLGIVIGAAYLLWMLQRVFFGPLKEKWTQLNDASLSEVVVLATLAVLIMAFGVSPKLITNGFEPEITALAQHSFKEFNAPPVFKRTGLMTANRSDQPENFSSNGATQK